MRWAREMGPAVDTWVSRQLERRAHPEQGLPRLSGPVVPQQTLPRQPPQWRLSSCQPGRTGAPQTRQAHPGE